LRQDFFVALDCLSIGFCFMLQISAPELAPEALAPGGAAQQNKEDDQQGFVVCPHSCFFSVRRFNVLQWNHHIILGGPFSSSNQKYKNCSEKTYLF
jgi:hypothetical protein